MHNIKLCNPYDCRTIENGIVFDVKFGSLLCEMNIKAEYRHQHKHLVFWPIDNQNERNVNGLTAIRARMVCLYLHR